MGERPGSVDGQLRWLRFGNRGHGHIDLDELGIAWLPPEVIAAWAARRFVRQNAVLWLSGEPPADLRLPLPDGAHRPGIDVTPAPGFVSPAWIPWERDAVAVSMLVPRVSSSVAFVAGCATRPARSTT